MFLVKLKTFPKSKKKENSIRIIVFGYENKKKHPICLSKKCDEDKNVDVLLIRKKDKKHYVHVKDSKTFM